MVLVSDDEVILEKEYIDQKSYEQENAFVKLENDPPGYAGSGGSFANTASTNFRN